jgi:lipopolysaccharide/colanic/teichoic acid biosynthesis glycosyltransferase
MQQVTANETTVEHPADPGFAATELSMAPSLSGNRAGTYRGPERRGMDRRPDAEYAVRELPGYRLAKRALDIAGASLFLLLTAPTYLLIAALIWREDRGPVLYWQWRVGLRGRRFRFYKFRSMIPNADRFQAKLKSSNEASGPIFKMKNDPRVTRIGRILRRYSLDELPQMVHVLRGDMSLIGPRPHLPREIAQCPQYPRERLSVPPGLLCLREIRGRSEMTFEQWIASDLEYVERRSFGMDLAILMRSVAAILAAHGAY